MHIEFEVAGIIPAAPMEIYEAWLDSKQHGAMTGGEAEVNDAIGTPFQAWDGYIEGVNLELIPGKLIKQRWRSAEFEADDEDSLLLITLEAEAEQTRVNIHHSKLPPHGMQYKEGWVDNYFTPMKSYFKNRKS